MKKINFLWLFVAAIMTATCFSACSDDDNDNDNKSSIVGTWDLVKKTWTEKINGELIDKGEDTYSNEIQYKFNSDGTFVKNYHFEGNADEKEYGRWKIQKGILTMMYDDEDDEYGEKATITSLTEDKLILEYNDKETDEDGTWEGWTKDEFRRVADIK